MLDIQTPDLAAARAARQALSALDQEPRAAVSVRVGDRTVALPADALVALRETLGQLAGGHGVAFLRSTPRSRPRRPRKY